MVVPRRYILLFFGEINMSKFFVFLSLSLLSLSFAGIAGQRIECDFDLDGFTNYMTVTSSGSGMMAISFSNPESFDGPKPFTHILSKDEVVYNSNLATLANIAEIKFVEPTTSWMYDVKFMGLVSTISLSDEFGKFIVDSKMISCGVVGE